MPKRQSFLKKLLGALGPGFITGAADDDPSGIATYSQTGVLFGFSQLWVALFSYPFMTVIQEMCGRIGMVTGMGLAGVIRKEYSKKILALSVLLLLIANTINIGADLGAMASSVQLLLPIPFIVLLIGITIFTLFLEVLVPYPTYARYLKYLTLSLLAYVITAFVIKENWSVILHSTFVPHIVWSKAYLMNIAAFLGTTISPYLFFWQADEEVEEEIVHHQIRGMGKGIPKVRPADLQQMRIDTAAGMFFSEFITFFIIVTVASALGTTGVTINTAADAASALRPLAGNFAFLLFTLGILGTGLLAVPTLAGSAAYALSETFNWSVGLSKKFKEAHGFYGIITLSMLVGLLVNFTPIGSITMLYYAAMLNGVLAPPLMILILCIANNKKILGARVNSPLSNWLGWFVTIIMSAVAIGLLISLFP